MKDCFLLCDFITQSSTLPFLEQFANTVVYTAMWYLGAHWVLWWKRKYPHIITRGKPSERFLSDVWLHHTEFHPSLPGTVPNTVVVDSAKVYLGAHRGLGWKSNYPHITTKEKLSEKLHCHVWMRLTELHVSLQWSVLLAQFSGNLQLDTS